MISADLTIINKLGLHARAAAKLATTAKRFACDSQLQTKGKNVDCKSVMALMLLAAAKGTEGQLQCRGSDEEAASTAIIELINNRFEEEE
jgi:phosphocarrier protein HPr